MAEKTEAPTGHRLNEARKKGQIARSTELNTAAAMLIGMLIIQSSGKQLVESTKTILTSTIQILPSADLSIPMIRQLAFNDAQTVLPSVGMILLVMLATGVSVTLAQTRFLWAGDRVKFDVSRLNPLNGLKRIFSNQGLFELGKAILKLSLVGWVAYTDVRAKIPEMMALNQYDLRTGVGIWVNMAFALGIRIGAVYLILAIGDYIYQYWHYMRSLRMSKDEIKEEMKQQEGDPFIKARVRGQMRRMARMRMMANVPKASVVITNPTHLAIAIQYDPHKMSAPRVVAKGQNLVAFRIADLARANNIPVIQNKPLARAIYKVVDIDQEIPPEFYTVIAELLAYVYRLRGQLRPATEV
jgi:flagellar biosynthesis protein FlhB